MRPGAPLPTDLRTRRGALAPGAVVAAVALLVTGCGEHDVLGPDGPGAQRIARIGVFMLVTAAAIGGGFVVLLVLALWRGGRRPARSDGERGFVVAGGVVLPAAVIGVLTVLSLNALNDRPPPDALALEVIGHQYWWEVRYPAIDGHDAFTTANEFVIPAGRPVALSLRSVDVQHSFWLPDLAGKMDLYPGRTNHLVIEADGPGRFRGQCAELCGVQHANMAFFVTAVPDADFTAYLARESGPARPPAGDAERAGLDAFLSRPCAGCHTIRGTPADGTLGPDLTHLAARRTIGAGVVANVPGHLGGWIANAQTIKPGNAMPPIPLTPEQLQDLLAYLGTLQ